MMKIVIFLTILAVAWTEEIEPSAEQLGRNILFTRTTSYFTTYANSGTSTVKTSCASLVNATTACRRRRGLEEKPVILSLDDDVVEPSAPVALEATAAPSLDDAVKSPTLEASGSKDEPFELNVLGYPNCAANDESDPQYRRITIIYTRTTTLPYSATTTSTAVYTIQGCSPSGVVTC